MLTSVLNENFAVDSSGYEQKELIEFLFTFPFMYTD